MGVVSGDRHRAVLFLLATILLAPACRPRSSAKPTLDPPVLTATAVTTTEIDLAWSPVPADATNVEIERSADGGATFALIATLPASQTTYSDTGLAPSTRYGFRVRFTRGSNAGGYSAIVFATTIVISSGTTTGGPTTALMGHSAIYDPVGNRMIVFGGLKGSAVTDELWILDLTPNPWTWSQVLKPSPLPPPPWVWPAPRMGHSAVYDSGNYQMVIFGGNDGTPPGNFPDLYALELNTLTWSSVALSGGSTPLARHDHSAIYDAAYKRMIVFDGTDDLGPFEEVWSLDLSTSPSSWSDLSTPGPVMRSDHSAVYDPVGQQMIIFGGQDTSAPGTYFSDVWALSLPDPAGATTPAWSPIVAAGGPSARFGHSAVLNGSKMAIFGGYDGMASREMWQLNLGATSTWDAVAIPLPNPAARLAHRSIFVAASSTMILFAGGTAPMTPAFFDVWQFGM